MTDLLVHRSAVIIGEFRVRLDRDYNRPGPTAAWLMVNPSTADGSQDDPTLGKINGFSARLGFGRSIVGNKFAFQATNVRDLVHALDPVGPDNDVHIEQILLDADIHIVAWGPLAKLPRHLRGRWREVVGIADRVGCRLQCFGTATDGHPLHPLMISYARTLQDWSRPE